jgi:hypothetical protein
VGTLGAMNVPLLDVVTAAIAVLPDGVMTTCAAASGAPALFVIVPAIVPVVDDVGPVGPVGALLPSLLL